MTETKYKEARVNGSNAESGRYYDLVFVGSGASATYTLVNVIDEAIANRKKANIALLDKSKYFHAGVAYGKRSGVRSLILTKVREFLPEEELGNFILWLRDHQAEEYQRLCGSSHEDRSDAATAQAIRQLCDRSIRRGLVGEYLQYRAEEAIRKAMSTGNIKISLISANVTSISRDESGEFLIDCSQSNAGIEHVRCKQLVLCIGSAVTRRLPKGDHFKPSVRVIDDLYDSCMDEAIDDALAALKDVDSSRRRLAVIAGTNASALDAIYVMKSLLDKYDFSLDILAVSHGGKFPEPVGDSSDSEKSPSLKGDIAEAFNTRLAGQEILTAESLYEAADSVFIEYHHSPAPLIHYRDLVDQEVIRYMDKLEADELSKFLIHFANKLGRHKRRVERTYHECAFRDSEKSRLSVESGVVVAVNNSDDDLSVEIRNRDGVQGRQCDLVINCTGGEFVDSTSTDPLLKNLLESGMVSSEEGSTGLMVTDNFQVSPNMYVIGPMLAGNRVQGSYVWHLEHLGRIIGFSKSLGSSIGKKLMDAVY